MDEKDDKIKKLASLLSLFWGVILLINITWLVVAGIVNLDLIMTPEAGLITACLLLVGLLGYPLAGKFGAGKVHRRVLLAGVICNLTAVGLYVLMVVTILLALS